MVSRKVTGELDTYITKDAVIVTSMTAMGSTSRVEHHIEEVTNFDRAEVNEDWNLILEKDGEFDELEIPEQMRE